MRPHLIIDCSLEEVGLASSLEALLGGAPARVVRARSDEPSPELRLGRVDPDEVESVIVSGSQASVLDERPWLPPLFRFLAACIEDDVPTLGICFGHQAIARALFGSGAVRRAWRSELGWIDVERVGDGPLLDGLPARFASFASHFDEVTGDLPGLDVLARTERCPVHGFQVRGRRAFGLQFHPELPPAVCEELVRLRLPAHPYLGTDGRAVLEWACDVRPVGRRIFARFLELARGPRRSSRVVVRHAG